MKYSKRKIREELFKILFGLEFENININEDNKLENINKVNDRVDVYLEIEEIEDENIKSYIKEFVLEYIEKYNYVESIIKSNIKETWDINRLSRISKALIRLAIIEIESFNLPYKVAVNEALELSKMYQEEKETKFINGLLAKYIKENDIEKMQESKKEIINETNSEESEEIEDLM